MSLRLIPPIAIPQTLPEVLSSLSGEDSQAAFKREIESRFNRRVVRVFSSGRAALTQCLKEIAPAGTLVCPAYTCWSVAAAAVAAGWKVRPVDMQPIHLDFEEEALHEALKETAGPTVCLAVHLLGLKPNLSQWGVLCDQSQTELVEDAAQAWPTGDSNADQVLLSFGRGKPLPLGGGGALLSKNYENEEVPNRKGGIKSAVSLMATTFLSKEALFRIPASIPALGIGTTEYNPNFNQAKGMYSWQWRLGVKALKQVDQWVQKRNHHAKKLIDALKVLEGLEFPEITDQATLIRLPIFAPSRTQRDAFVSKLRERGVAASVMYPGTLPKVQGLKPYLAADAPCPGADSIANRLVTLPIYPTLSDRQIDKIESETKAVWNEVVGQ